MMGMMSGCSAGWSWGLVGLLGMVLFWVAVIAVIAFIVRGFGRGAPTSFVSRGAPDDRALTMLRERFARGEIDRAEYEERRGTLRDELSSF